jgi:serine/threonine protein kinase
LKTQRIILLNTNKILQDKIKMDQEPSQSFESYKKIKVIGKGSFGKAFLVQAESDGSYAVIKKIDIAKLSE